MHSSLRLLIALVSAFVLGLLGCTSTAQGRRADDYRTALLAALTRIEGSFTPQTPDAPQGFLVLVISRATPSQLRQACAALRTTVYDYDLPNTDTLSLPARHLQPEYLVISGDTAVFKGVLGPVPLPGTPTSGGACGTTYDLRLLRQADGSWRSVGGSTELCRFSHRRLRHSAA